MYASNPINQVTELQAELQQPAEVYENHLPIFVELTTADKWSRCAAIGTIEMRSSSGGRLITPGLHYTVTGLYPDAVYTFGIELQKRSGELEYKGGRFIEKASSSTSKKEGAERTKAFNTSPLFMEPKCGAEWMEKGVDMTNYKVYTVGNKSLDDAEKPAMMHVQYRHLYVVVLKVMQVTPDGQFFHVAEFTNDLTRFVPVSAYLNRAMRAEKSLSNQCCRKDYKAELRSAVAAGPSTAPVPLFVPPRPELTVPQLNIAPTQFGAFPELQLQEHMVPAGSSTSPISPIAPPSPEFEVPQFNAASAQFGASPEIPVQEHAIAAGSPLASLEPTHPALTELAAHDIVAFFEQCAAPRDAWNVEDLQFDDDHLIPGL